MRGSLPRGATRHHREDIHSRGATSRDACGLPRLRLRRRRRAEQQRGDELAVSSVYVQPPAELLVEAIAVYRAAYALAKQQQEDSGSAGICRVEFRKFS